MDLARERRAVRSSSMTISIAGRGNRRMRTHEPDREKMISRRWESQTLTVSFRQTCCSSLLDGEAGYELLGGAFCEGRTIAQLLQLPPENIAQLRFLIDPEPVLL